MKRINRKGFTLVELLAVIVILAILMAIAATNIGPVIDNSRRSSMRTTAQNIVEAVRLQLTSNYELFPGQYGFTQAILDSGGTSAPFGGVYAYYTPAEGKKKIGSGVYSVDPAKTTSTSGECAAATYSYVVVSRSEDTYTWSICLTTKDLEGGYLYGTRQDIDNKDNTTIFFGRAAIASSEATS